MKCHCCFKPATRTFFDGKKLCDNCFKDCMNEAPKWRNENEPKST